MSVLDRQGILRDLASRDQVVLELGCGDRKRNDRWIGIDVSEHEGVDLVGDACEALKLFPSGSVDEVHSFHFLEHVADLDGLLQELARVIKTGGTLEAVVPHFSNPYHYSDYTHRRFFGLYSFSYLAEDGILRRRVPRYSGRTDFELLRVDLVFKSAPPFFGRYLFKRVLGLVFNCCTYSKELYEEMFCHWVPCYEIRFMLRRK